MPLQSRPVKTAVRKLPLVDSYFGNRYSFSPYRGCVHACAYCDGRAEKYYVEGDFEKDIIVRPNLPERLAEELPRLREKGFILAGSGVTDPYQPAEAREQLMSQAADILLDHNFPVLVTTKNALVNRDRVLWKRVEEKNGFILLMTLANLHEEDRLVFEPGASSVEERVNTLNGFKKEGIPVGVMIMPLLPFLWDTRQRLTALLDRLKEMNVDFLLPGPLTLRPGIQKETFIEVLKKTNPGLVPAYGDLYAENRASGSPVWSYRKDLFTRLSRMLLERELPFLMPHRLFKGKVSLADEVHILIRHLMELYSPRGIDTRPVKEAESRYTRWLLPRRQEFNRKRSLSRDHLDNQIRLACGTGEIENILDNPRLGKFMTNIILGGEVLDYISLKTADFQ